MKLFYDLILGLCCYKSCEQTLALVHSADRLAGNILFTVTTVTEDDTAMLKAQLPISTRHDVILYRSDVDSRYFCQNWGFVDSMIKGVSARFWGTMDDDCEFTERADIVNDLYNARRVGFSVLGFASTSHAYADYVGLGNLDAYKQLAFVDGHNMFSQIEDNLRFGLCDQVGEGNTSYVEVEYANRLKYFTAKPILAQIEKISINHTFRKDLKLNELRVPFQSRDTSNGEQLYRRKYGIKITPGDVEHFSWVDVIDKMNQAAASQRMQHLVYGGLSEWTAIYDAYSKDFTHVLP